MPINFSDFEIFIIRIKEANKDVSDLETNPTYKSIRLLLNNQSVKDEPSAYDATADDFHSSSSGNTAINANATLALFAEFWSNDNYLYPVYFDNRVRYNPYNRSYRGSYYDKMTDADSLQEKLSIKLPGSVNSQYPFMPNKPISLYKGLLPPVMQFNKLKFGLFYDLSDCPSIESTNCFFRTPKPESGSIIRGYSRKKLQFEIFKWFIVDYEMDIYYPNTLKQLKQIVATIQLMHEKEYYFVVKNALKIF